ncbi:hypothetical protein E8E13_004683 [Curvularia kusanoi]|uniref:Uncharacterized protein n=1 Tax=Curvularia kusanoi TaxID=90978 RepID=A0A9P4W7H5_CURKU|nr:hypothetical protein E8E13_004683 [Curvularia kusanoi]
MSHSHIHLPSLLDFTPPSSPTRLFESMHWLKRAPTSSPVPPSPTASCSALDNEDDCRPHTPTISPSEPHAQDTTTVATPPLLLHKNPSMFSLRSKTQFLISHTESQRNGHLLPRSSALGVSCGAGATGEDSASASTSVPASSRG